MLAKGNRGQLARGDMFELKLEQSRSLSSPGEERGGTWAGECRLCEDVGTGSPQPVPGTQGVRGHGERPGEEAGLAGIVDTAPERGGHRGPVTE